MNGDGTIVGTNRNAPEIADGSLTATLDNGARPLFVTVIVNLPWETTTSHQQNNNSVNINVNVSPSYHSHKEGGRSGASKW